MGGGDIAPDLLDPTIPAGSNDKPLAPPSIAVQSIDSSPHHGTGRAHVGLQLPRGRACKFPDSTGLQVSPRTWEYRDPGQLVWPVNKILRLDLTNTPSPRPLPARPEGEADSRAIPARREMIHSCSVVPSRRISFTCRTSRQGSRVNVSERISLPISFTCGINPQGSGRYRTCNGRVRRFQNCGGLGFRCKRKSRSPQF